MSTPESNYSLSFTEAELRVLESALFAAGMETKGYLRGLPEADEQTPDVAEVGRRGIAIFERDMESAGYLRARLACQESARAYVSAVLDDIRG